MFFEPVTQAGLAAQPFPSQIFLGMWNPIILSWFKYLISQFLLGQVPPNGMVSMGLQSLAEQDALVLDTDHLIYMGTA
jgi:hypothetical protein